MSILFTLRDLEIQGSGLMYFVEFNNQSMIYELMGTGPTVHTIDINIGYLIDVNRELGINSM